MSLICLSRGHPSACQHCYCAERGSSGSANLNVRSTKEDFVCFLHHCLQGFEWCQEHTANANGSLHHSVALSAFYREANSLAVRRPVTHESEDPQTVWTAVNILFSSVLLSSTHREEFIGHHYVQDIVCFSHKCLLHWRLVSYFIFCTK